MDYSEALVKLKEIHPKDKAILSGSWTHFFHIVADLFGMEQYFMKMYTDPAGVLLDNQSKGFIDETLA